MLLLNTIGILAFVPDLWNDQYQSRHHILRGLSKHYKVLWISPSSYVEGWRRNGFKASLAGRGLQKLSDNIWCYAPRLPADYKYRYVKSGITAACFRTYHAQWQKLFVKYIKRLLKLMGIEQVILYIWRPKFHWALGQFNDSLACYHIDDEYSFDPKKDHGISVEERKLLEESDIVFIHSKTLLEKKGHINKNTYYMPNGVDYEMYRSVIENSPCPPDDISSIPKPVIGYAGWIKKHLDLKLLLNIARKRRDWSIVLVGPIRYAHKEILEDIELLKKQKNVYFLGCKQVDELPLYINAMDVCLMPYRLTPYTKYIYPLKLHEYLACGKPVVSTKLEQINEYKEVLYFADSQQHWINQITRALNESEETLIKKRNQIAKENSWQVKCNIINNEFKKILK